MNSPTPRNEELNPLVGLKKIVLTIPALIPPIFIFILSCTPGITFSEDMGRHLLMGKIIIEKGYIPQINFLTYTYYDFPFINHHWLSQVIFYLSHDFLGLNGMILFKMIILTITISLAVSVIKIKRHYWVIWISGIMSAIILGYRAHIRPELFSFIFIALLLFIFEKDREGYKKIRWCLIPIMILWINMHIYFIFGIGMLGAFAIENILIIARKRSLNPKEKATKATLGIKKEILHEVCWLSILIGITLINPNGIDGLLYPFKIFTNYGVNIVENISPLELWETVLNPMLLLLPIISLWVIGSIIYELWYFYKHRDKDNLKRVRLANIIIAIASLIAAWIMARNTPLLAISALPIIVSSTNKIPYQKYSPKFLLQSFYYLLYSSLSIITIAIIIAIVNGLFFRIFPAPIGPTPFGFDPNPQRWNAISTAISKNIDSDNVFTDYNIGSLVEYELYPQKGYVDNRPEAFPITFWENEYFPALSLGKKWYEVVKKRNINLIIISLTGVSPSFVKELTSRSMWKLIYLDENCLIWIKNIEKNREVIDLLQFDKKRIDKYEREISERLLNLPQIPWWKRQVELDIIIYRLYSLICIGENMRAWSYIYQLFQQYPHYQIIHELMLVTAPKEKVKEILPTFKFRAYWPLSVKEVINYRNHLLAIGEKNKALKVLSRGRLFFPLSPILRSSGVLEF